MQKKVLAIVLCTMFILSAVMISFAQDKGNIIFLTKKDWVYYAETGTQPASGHYADSLYVADLRKAGYNVQVPNYDDYKTLGPAEVSALNFADLVILGRGVSSGDFNDDDDYLWADLRTPILLMSNFTARAKRLSWFRSNSQLNIHQIDTSFAKIEVPEDPIFNGLDLPEDKIIPYTKDVLYPLVAHKDSVGMNGKVILSLAGIGTGYGLDLDVGMVRDTLAMADYEDHILMARWDPGVPMYSGSIDGFTAAVPAGYRSYITVGGETFDDDSSRQVLKYYAFTDFMNQVFLREVERLIALPVPPPPVQKNIIFLTKKDWVYYAETGTQPASGHYADSLYVADLRKAGYNVQVPNYDDYKTLGPAEVSALNFADLVILGRGVSSGDFNDADDYLWAELTTPILLMSNFTARANRLSWIRTNSQKNIHQIDTSFAKVEVPNDPIFTGLDIPEDNIIPYTKDVLYPVVAHKDSVGMNGEVILSLAGIGTGYGLDLDVGMVRDTLAMADYEDHILMARWDPGVPMYSGLINGFAAAVPAGYRSYITVGGETFDNDSSRQVLKYYAFTDFMNQVFLREVERLMTLPVPPPPVKKNILFLTKKDWVYYAETGTQPAAGHYADSLYVADLRKTGYNVQVPNYDDYKTLGPEQVSALNFADLVILGRGVSSGDFNDDDDHLWAELTKPILLMSNFTARANRLGWIRTNSQKNIHQIDTSFAKIEVPEDPIFNGLDLPEDKIIPYTKDVLYPLVAHKDSVGMNGEVILSLAGIGTGYGLDLDVGMVRDTLAMADYEDHILMARWAPGDSMYSGVIDDFAAAVPAGYRSYITVGGETFDYDSSRQVLKYYAFTDFMKQVFLSEVERLLVLPVPEPPVKKKILFLTNQDWVYYAETGTQPAAGHYADSLYVADLRNEGYEVIVPAYGNYKTLGQEQIDSLINVDLVILGRGVSSGDFNDDDDYVWEQLGTPIMLMSNFTARANRLGWICTNSQKNIHQIDTSFAKVEVPEDPIFKGLKIPQDNIIPYTEDVLYPLVAHKDSVGMNGQVVLSQAGIGTGYGLDLDVGMVRDTLDMAEYEDHILMARWAPGDSMYSGVIDGFAAAVPAGYRSYITVGGETFDYDSSRQVLKYYAFTDFMKQAWLNEVARMVHLWLPSDITPPAGISGTVSRPLKYSLMQNYPNPFNPTTSIEFTLAKTGQTTIKIYNVMGQLVSTLVDQKMKAGKHKVIFEGRSFASGLYFFKIESGEFTKVRKMMLMK